MRKQKIDRADAPPLLKPPLENRFPQIYITLICVPGH
jgi:hypothetical protein